MLDKIIRKNMPPMEPLPTGVAPRLDRLAGIKAVVFDIYGTLFVSGSGDIESAASDTAEAAAQALKATGYVGDLEAAGRAIPVMLHAEIQTRHERERAAGTDCPEVEIRDIWRTILNRLNLAAPDAEGDPVERLVVEYECRANPAFPMPGCMETIAALRAKGLVLGIVSNAQFYTPLLFPAFFGRTVAECGFDPDCCIWSYEELRAKPSTALFRKLGGRLAEKHGIALEETVFVGNDMLNDIACAAWSSCRTVLFAGDLRSLRLRENDERCLAIRPDAVVTFLPHLLEIIRPC